MYATGGSTPSIYLTPEREQSISLSELNAHAVNNLRRHAEGVHARTIGQMQKDHDVEFDKCKAHAASLQQQMDAMVDIANKEHTVRNKMASEAEARAEANRIKVASEWGSKIQEVQASQLAKEAELRAEIGQIKIRANKNDGAVPRAKELERLLAAAKEEKMS